MVPEISRFLNLAKCEIHDVISHEIARYGKILFLTTKHQFHLSKWLLDREKSLEVPLFQGNWAILDHFPI